MFLSKVPHRLKPLLRIDGSEEISFERGVQIFVESQLEKYSEDKRGWYSHGYEYYGSILLGKRILLEVVPNIRDISQFVRGVSIRRHILYRGGRPGGVEPDKIKHIIRDTLGIRTIVDLRGMIIFDDSCLTKDEVLSRSVLWKYYTPIFENENIDNYVQERGSSDSGSRNGLENERVPNDIKFLILLNSLDYNVPLKIDNRTVEASSSSDERSPLHFCLSCVKRYRGSEPEPREKTNEEIFIEKRRKIMIPRSICCTYYLLNMISPVYAEKWYLSKYIELRTMGGVYFDVAIFDFKTICRALKVITVSIPPILLHGNLGKDRVSVVVSIILSVLGVADEYIIRDYCASDSGLLSIREAIETEMRPFPSLMKESTPENIQYFLSKMREEFGSINAYLDLIGFDAHWRSRLCKKFKCV
ncbi:serine/tyrosine phosphatase [Cryptosporidium canis]|uniref:Serine/tyrosine phosphatase n=1 Tax=Cryptosporidium canis TaxID=195482 RepID=A0A9D5HWH4_9CRYT|nr:serine/tyrosine phosphatase [Cryptosporidium canis]